MHYTVKLHAVVKVQNFRWGNGTFRPPVRGIFLAL